METQVSVLITFYNQEQYVDDAIKSVMSQITGFDYKVIIGDDGSNDGTVDKITKWIEKYPDRITLYRNNRGDEEMMVGARSSRNRIGLLRKVDTPFFIFLDGDDYWTSEHKLDIQYNILSNPKNSDCICCGHQIRAYHESEGMKKSKQEYYPNLSTRECKLSLEEYWIEYYVSTNAIMFRSDIIKEIDLDLLQDFFNDELITYSCLQYGKMYYIPKCLCDYRKNDNGIWAGNKDRRIGLIRNLIMMDMEIKINSNMYRTSLIKHLSSIERAKRGEIRNLNSKYDIYLKKIQENKCVLTNKLIEGNNIFSDNDIIERLNVAWVKVIKITNRIIGFIRRRVVGK